MRGSECHIVETPQGGYSTQATLANTPLSLLLLSGLPRMSCSPFKKKENTFKNNGYCFTTEMFFFFKKTLFEKRKYFLHVFLHARRVDSST